MKAILLILIYVISCISVNNWFETAFSKKGRWGSLERDLVSYIFTYVPVCNTMAVFYFCTHNPIRK